MNITQHNRIELALLKTLEDSNTDRVKSMIDSGLGQEISPEGKTFAHFLFQIGSSDLSRYQRDIIINIFTYFVTRNPKIARMEDSSGQSVYHLSFHSKNNHFAKILIENDVSPINASILKSAIESRSWETLVLATKKGADLSRVDTDGNTAFHYAAKLTAKFGNSLIDYLSFVKNRIDISEINHKNENFLHIIASNLPEILNKQHLDELINTLDYIKKHFGKSKMLKLLYSQNSDGKTPFECSQQQFVFEMTEEGDDMIVFQSEILPKRKEEQAPLTNWFKEHSQMNTLEIIFQKELTGRTRLF